jgi:hypothetical protein
MNNANAHIEKSKTCMTTENKPKREIYFVLISGELGSGKTTTQTALYKELTERFTSTTHVISINFADELKRECAVRAGVDQSVFYTEAGKREYYESVNMTGRELLQSVGEEARQFHHAFWINKAKQTLSTIVSLSESERFVVIIGDCHHPNEVELLRPGMSVRLQGDPGGVRAQSDADLTHVSERALDGYKHFDMIVDTETQRPNAIVECIINKLSVLRPSIFAHLSEKKVNK